MTPLHSTWAWTDESGQNRSVNPNVIYLIIPYKGDDHCAKTTICYLGARNYYLFRDRTISRIAERDATRN